MAGAIIWQTGLVAEPGEVRDVTVVTGTSC